MKRFQELTDVEVLALSEEEIERYIKLEMAEEGIKILQKPVEPKYKTIPEGDELTYGVGGFADNVVFKEKGAAQRIADAITKELPNAFDLSYNRNYSLRYLKKADTEYTNLGVVKHSKHYKKETLDRIEEDKTANDDLKRIYEKELKEYDSENNRASRIRSDIWDRVHYLQQQELEKERNLTRYKEYLELANGNPEIAMNFLKKAYTIDEQTEQYILGNVDK